MFLPLGIIRGLKMPASRKLSLCVLFCLGVCCIIAATIRAVQLAGDMKAAPPTAWLALWNVIESSVGKLWCFRPVGFIDINASTHGT